MQSVRNGNVEAVEELNALNKEAVKKTVNSSGQEQLDDVKGIEQIGIPIKSKINGKVYYVRPCSLSELPKLVKLIGEFDAFIEKYGKNAVQMLTAEDGKMIKIMGDIINLGNPDLDKDELLKSFTLGNFPEVYKIILDINDFLSGMRTIYS